MRSSDSESRRSEKRNPVDEESSSPITDMQGMSISQPAENAAQQEPRDIPLVKDPSFPKLQQKRNLPVK